MQRVVPDRHEQYCSLYLEQDHDIIKDPIKETCFILPTDLYQTPIFCKKDGICLEKLVAIMQAALEHNSMGKEFYLGMALQLFLRGFTTQLVHFCTNQKQKQVFSTLVEKIAKEIKSPIATGRYLPVGIWTIKFVSSVEEGGILIRIHYDPRLLDFMLNPVETVDIGPDMSPNSFFV